MRCVLMAFSLQIPETIRPYLLPAAIGLAALLVLILLTALLVRARRARARRRKAEGTPAPQPTAPSVSEAEPAEQTPGAPKKYYPTLPAFCPEGRAEVTVSPTDVEEHDGVLCMSVDVSVSVDL